MRARLGQGQSGGSANPLARASDKRGLPASGLGASVMDYAAFGSAKGSSSDFSTVLARSVSEVG